MRKTIKVAAAAAMTGLVSIYLLAPQIAMACANPPNC